ncbi:G-D-S-L family lipolytic protein [Bacillus sp. 1NLA3E]|nr:G-D-S-L family lipolytic protein [Bacillus sp. 1NLA3E]
MEQEVFLMRKTFLLLLVCTQFLGGCTIFHQEQAKANPTKAIEMIKKKAVPTDYIPQDINVVLVGDSLTEGVGDKSKKGGYMPYLKNLLGKEKGINEAKFLNFGVRGNTTTQLLDRLKSSEVKNAIKQADLVMITIGGNDMMKVVSENISNLKIEDFENDKNLFRKHLSQILTQIRSNNSTGSIVLVGLYNPFSTTLSDIKEINQVINEWNESSQNIISQYDLAYFVDISDLFSGKVDDLLYTDHFHPNNKGYELIAQRLYRRLDKDVLKDLPNQVYTANKEGIQQ